MIAIHSFIILVPRIDRDILFKKKSVVGLTRISLSYITVGYLSQITYPEDTRCHAIFFKWIIGTIKMLLLSGRWRYCGVGGSDCSIK